jgi:AcrR family transcriptional regulator
MGVGAPDGDEREDDRESGGFQPGGRPLPLGLSRLPAGHHGLASEIVRESQRRRILGAALELFGRRGLLATSVQDLVREAHVSRATFYGVFPDKEACFLRLYEEGIDWLWAGASRAAAGEDDWAGAVCAAVEEVIGMLGADERFARVCTNEVYLGGEAIANARDGVIARVGAKLSLGRHERGWGPELPGVLEHLLVAGTTVVLGRRFLDQDGVDLDVLASEISEVLLGPYLGSVDAKALVGGRT